VVGAEEPLLPGPLHHPVAGRSGAPDGGPARVQCGAGRGCDAHRQATVPCQTSDVLVGELPGPTTLSLPGPLNCG